MASSGEVALALDTPRSARTYPELAALVAAIRDAPSGEPETDSLEWKRELDLASRAEHRFALARHILGFGNRLPIAAEPYFEGCAYLVVGAEPGALTSAPEWDPADLHNWIGAYVAAGAPRWRHDRVTVDGTGVVVFTVEPPEWGDPIRTLQKGHNKHVAGRIFVRRGGKTEEASPSDVAQLEGRTRRGAADIEVHVEARAAGGELLALDLAEEPRAAWVAKERERLLAPLVRTPRPIRSLDLLTYSPQDLEPLVYDSRSEDAYRDDVETYLSRAALCWDAEGLAKAIGQKVGLVELTLHNASHRNFPGTQIELTLPVGVRAFFDEDGPAEQLDPPEAPEPWGQKSRYPSIKIPAPPAPFVEEEILYDDRGVTVRFAPVHVRPGTVRRLPDLYLAVPLELAGSGLTLTWRATSTGATRWAQGEADLGVAMKAATYGRTRKGDSAAGA